MMEIHLQQMTNFNQIVSAKARFLYVRIKEEMPTEMAFVPTQIVMITTQISVPLAILVMMEIQ